MIHGDAIFSAVYITAFCIGLLVDNSTLIGRFRIYTDWLKKRICWFFSRCYSFGIKRILKLGFFYTLYLAIVWVFDYFYMPWLGIKFRYFMVIPLYLSLFAISWFGLWLCRFFGEKLFVDEIRAWLAKESKFRPWNFVKKKINGSQRFQYVAISIDWSPLHSYLFFKQGETDDLWEVAKSFAVGSFYCALFWGLVVDIIILLWDLLKPFFWLLWELIKLKLL